jgi:TfoX/Sxy family transcriptional regulator of competence genes
MAYDEDLADRIREAVQHEDGITEKRMFGGLAFLVHGHLAVAASGRGGLMVRVDPEQSESLVSTTPACRMVMRGREMDGWLRLDDESIEADATLTEWVGRGVSYAGSLPPK